MAARGIGSQPPRRLFAAEAAVHAQMAGRSRSCKSQLDCLVVEWLDVVG